MENSIFDGIFETVREKLPLVHCITNYVTVNDCANMLLACGGSPIMADDSLEVEEVTSLCKALVINIGTLNARTVESMIKAGKKANALGHPVIFDPVGIGASQFRRETAFKLMEAIQFTVIRGNISEIKTIYKGTGMTQGVDACEADEVTESNLEETINFARSLSQQTGAIIAITGAIDLVVNEKEAYAIKNGHALMAKVTGTGCMLTSVIGGFVAACPEQALKAVVAAISAMGLCGELAYEKMLAQGSGTGSYKVYLIDYMSQMNTKLFREGQKIEIK